MTFAILESLTPEKEKKTTGDIFIEILNLHIDIFVILRVLLQEHGFQLVQVYFCIFQKYFKLSPFRYF